MKILDPHTFIKPLLSFSSLQPHPPSPYTLPTFFPTTLHFCQKYDTKRIFHRLVCYHLCSKNCVCFAVTSLSVREILHLLMTAFAVRNLSKREECDHANSNLLRNISKARSLRIGSEVLWTFRGYRAICRISENY